jgi:hypothetical protein
MMFSLRAKDVPKALDGNDCEKTAGCGDLKDGGSGK